MARNNDVNKILVTAGNQAPIGVGKKVTDLAPGQIGLFDYGTNMSLDAAGAAKSKNFYFAVGLDKDGDGVTDDIMKSSGSHIQKENVVGYSHKKYQAPKNLLVELTDYLGECGAEYGVKLEVRNQEIYAIQGYNQYVKTFTIKTGCCDPLDPNSPEIDSNTITIQLSEEINMNPDNFLKAYMVDKDATDLTVVLTKEQVEAYIEANKTAADADKKFTKILIETDTLAIKNFCDVNLGYFYPRQTTLNITKLEGFKCNGTVNVLQPIVYEEGSGYDVKQLEYYSKGFGEEGPYRLHSVLGVAKQVHYNTDQKAKYDLIALTYDQFSLGAWLEYLHNEASTIAVPKDDTTTLTALKALITGLGIEETV